MPKIFDMAKAIKKLNKKEKDKTSDLVDLANELLSLLGTKAKATAVWEEENETFMVSIDTDDESGLLIGRHGETLEAIQTALGMIFRQRSGEWARIVVNVGDWRERQEEYLKNIARQTAAKAEESGEPQALYNLTPAQRRVIHLELSGNPKVETESIGEDKERYLIVKPK